MYNFKKGDNVSVFGFIGEIVEIKGDKVLVHFGGDALHFSQEWYKVDEVEITD
jgi:preprotein translocase subunit YajC